MKNTNKGFTLIALIMVTIILGILAAVAVPRYMTSVASAEKAAEDAVIASINAGLDSYATDKLISTGREYWPDNPFTALKTAPSGYDNTDTDNADSDGEWTYNTTDLKITHQRQDNSIHTWTYAKGTNNDPDNNAVGAGIGPRVSL